jgi:hypothetical protein
MTIDDATRITRAHLETQFPKACACGQTFASLRDYLRNTAHVGEPISYDADLMDVARRALLGTMSFANCRCGSTIALTSKGMDRLTLLRLMAWGLGESARRRISFSALLAEVRDRIDAQVLAEPAFAAGAGEPGL